jgi:CheY-like chemotaxis protein
VLLNLLSNAVKFTSQGRCVLTVRSKSVSVDRAMLTVSVEDSGAGIATELQQKIFEPFRQGGGRLQHSEGSGLGLAISRTLVRLMGGELQVISPCRTYPLAGEGPGSRFFFSIEVRMQGGDQPALPAAVSAGKKILVVDNKAAHRAVLGNILESAGFQAHELADQSKIVEACLHLQPDAVLLDFHLPEMDSLPLTRQLREHPELKDIPVIAVAASEDAEHGSQSEQFAACVIRPFSSLDLLAVLTAQLAIPMDKPRASALASLPGWVWPPAEELTALAAFARTGDIAGLQRKIAWLAEAEDGRWRSFAAKVEELADNFQLNQIVSLADHSKNCAD